MLTVKGLRRNTLCGALAFHAPCAPAVRACLTQSDRYFVGERGGVVARASVPRWLVFQGPLRSAIELFLLRA